MSTTVRLVDFANEGEFVSYCYDNNVDGSPTLLWSLLSAYGKLEIYFK